MRYVDSYVFLDESVKWSIFQLWFIVWRNCCFVTGRACVRAGLRHEGGWALLVWMQFERAHANFTNFAILKSNFLFLFVHKHLNAIGIYYMITWINFLILKGCHIKLFNNTYNIFCFDRLNCRVLTSLQWHLFFNDITSHFVSISKARNFISLSIAILKFVWNNYILI